jgi:hypothetical protein
VNFARRDSIAPEVMTRCPVTGVEVPTGYSLVSADEFHHMALGRLLFKCRACRQLHEWSKHDAFLRYEVRADRAPGG